MCIMLFFAHFFAAIAGNYNMKIPNLHFMEDVNTGQQFYFPFSELI